MVGDLRLKIEASTGGQPYRPVATGIRQANGSIDFRAGSGELMPQEMLAALQRHLDEFQPSVGSWNYKVGDTDYRAFFTRTPI
jgi:hypothetical protein